jgi:hypothetical protein
VGTDASNLSCHEQALCRRRHVRINEHGVHGGVCVAGERVHLAAQILVAGLLAGTTQSDAD